MSVNRVTKFLLNEELDLNSIQRIPSGDVHAVQITKGNFSWDGGPDAQPMLRDINLSVADGTLVAIVGQVGTGKSSLLAAMLGLMEKLSGDVAVKENVAYVTQQVHRYISNGSIYELSSTVFRHDVRFVTLLL